MFLVIVLAVAGLIGPADPGHGIDCAIFDDGVKSHEEVLEICAEFDEDYHWEGITEHQPVSECWKQYDALLVESCDSTYTVSDGDLSLWTISQKLGISFGALLDANSEGSPDLIHVGDVIILP